MRIEVPEYNTFVEFPDNTPQEKILAVLRKNFPAKGEDAFTSPRADAPTGYDAVTSTPSIQPPGPISDQEAMASVTGNTEKREPGLYSGESRSPLQVGQDYWANATPEERLVDVASVVPIERFGAAATKVAKGVFQEIASKIKNPTERVKFAKDVVTEAKASGKTVDEVAQIKISQPEPIKAAPENVEPKEYHGTSVPLKGLQEYVYSPFNLYGPGFYTTENLGIAKGYSRKGGGSSPTIYEVKWKGDNPPRFLDLEKPLPDKALRVFEVEKKHNEFIPDNLKGRPTREIYKEMRENMAYEEITAEEAESLMDQISVKLGKVGYDGFTHIGGRYPVREGKPEHQVRIYFNPQKNLDIKTITPSPESLEALVKGGKVGELPKYAEGSAINLERLDTTDDVKQFLNTMTKQKEAEIGKGKVSWAETAKAAEELAWDKKEFLKEASKRGGFTAAEHFATRQIHANALNDVFNTIKTIPADEALRTDAMRLAVMDKVNNFIEVMKATSQKASEAGRSLNIYKKMISENPEFAHDAIRQKVFKQIFENNGGKEITDKMIGDLQKVDFSDPKAVRDILQKYHKAGITDMVYEGWMNGLLSAPVTHAANMFGNTLTLITKIPETAVAKVLKGKSPLGEVRAETFGAMQGMKEGIRAALRAFRDGVTSDIAMKVEGKRLNAIPGKTGEAIRIPTRALTAEDEFFKSITYRAELNRQAYNIAAKEGLSGEQMANRIADLINNPTSDISRTIYAKAREESLYRTFNKPLGEFGNSIMRLRDKVPGLKYVIPFIRTPANIAKFTLERTPFNFGKIALDYKRGKIAEGELTQELAKPIVGSMIAAATTVAVLEGNITGAPPKNQKERQLKYATGWQPYSIKVGNTYYGYNRLEPIGSIMGMTADFVESARSDDEINEKAGKIITSLSRNIASKTFLQGISGMLDAISDPERSGGNLVEKFAGSIIPSGVASVARATDPYIRDVQTPFEAIQARIPGASKNLPYKPGVKTKQGEIPAMRGGSKLTRFISPVQVSEEKNPAIRRAIEQEIANTIAQSKQRKSVNELKEEYMRKQRMRALK